MPWRGLLRKYPETLPAQWGRAKGMHSDCIYYFMFFFSKCVDQTIKVILKQQTVVNP